VKRHSVKEKKNWLSGPRTKVLDVAQWTRNMNGLRSGKGRSGQKKTAKKENSSGRTVFVKPSWVRLQFQGGDSIEKSNGRKKKGRIRGPALHEGDIAEGAQ